MTVTLDGFQRFLVVPFGCSVIFGDVDSKLVTLNGFGFIVDVILMLETLYSLSVDSKLVTLNGFGFVVYVVSMLATL